MELLDGTIYEPVGMELDQLRIVRYKQFLSNCSLSLNEQIEEAYVFDLAESLTTLVGPNNSGKTTLLKAVQLFCQAVKYGSGGYSLNQAKEFFGIEQFMLSVVLQGTFTVHYHGTTETRKLKLNVILARSMCNCTNNEKDWTTVYANNQHKDSSQVCVNVCVTEPDADFRCFRTSYHEQSYTACYRSALLYKNNYAILEKLFPQVIPFNSKSVFTGNLKSLFIQMPKIPNYRENINSEIARIFPFIRINYKDEIDIEKLSSMERINRTICATVERYIPVLGTGVKQLSEDGEILDQHVEDIGVCSEGVLQCLSVIITICCAEPNSIITIDEPDSHVFPNAQKLLIKFFHRKLKEFNLSKRFCQMIITTHSTDIMQAVELKEIRQIFLDPSSHSPMEIKSLSSTSELLSIMTALGTSILGHDEIVRLGVHRKLLYLESREDFDFMSGIIQRVKPELLFHPFTIIYKGGRPQPDQIKQLIPGFRHFIPKNSTLSIFVLVDPDLKREKILQNEATDYTLLEADQTLKLKVYYHCWPVREWENWLLFNENLLYEMLFGERLKQERSIQALREQIDNNYAHMQQTSLCSGVFQQNQSAMTTTATTTNMSHPYSAQENFPQWFATELTRHYHILLKDLTSSKMEGTESNDPWNSNELAEEGKQFLRDAGVDDEQMKKIFGKILIPILHSIGAQNRKYDKPRKKKLKTDKEADLEKTRAEWLEKRQIHQSINLSNEQTRKTLTNWIDAKEFFYQLTDDRNIRTKGSKIDLNKYWKGAFTLEPLDNNRLYSRYFNSLDPADEQKWPRDFTKLLENFEKFVKTPQD